MKPEGILSGERLLADIFPPGIFLLILDRGNEARLIRPENWRNLFPAFSGIFSSQPDSFSGQNYPDLHQ